jgi:hypothetical protein
LFEEMPRDLDTKVARAEVYATTPELGVEVVGLYPEDDLEDLVLLGCLSGFCAKVSRQKSKLEALPFDRTLLLSLFKRSGTDRGGERTAGIKSRAVSERCASLLPLGIDGGRVRGKVVILEIWGFGELAERLQKDFCRIVAGGRIWRKVPT